MIALIDDRRRVGDDLPTIEKIVDDREKTHFIKRITIGLLAALIMAQTPKNGQNPQNWHLLLHKRFHRGAHRFE